MNGLTRIPVTRVVLDLNDLELAQLRHLAETAPFAAHACLIAKIIAATPAIALHDHEINTLTGYCVQPGCMHRELQGSMFLRRQAE